MEGVKGACAAEQANCRRAVAPRPVEAGRKHARMRQKDVGSGAGTSVARCVDWEAV